MPLPAWRRREDPRSHTTQAAIFFANADIFAPVEGERVCFPDGLYREALPFHKEECSPSFAGKRERSIGRTWQGFTIQSSTSNGTASVPKSSVSRA